MANSILCEFPILGTISLSFRNAELHKFCLRQLQYYGAREAKRATGLSVDAELIVDNVDSHITDVMSKGDRLISKKCRVSAGQIDLDRKRLLKNINYNFTTQGRAINCEMRITQPLSSTLYYQVSKTAYDRSHELFFELVINPIAALIYLQAGYYAVHGAMLEKGERRVLFYGLDGVGKSTVTAKLMEKGWHYCSDNVCFYNGVSAFGLALPIRTETSVDTLGSAHLFYSDKQVKEWVFDQASLSASHVSMLYQMVKSTVGYSSRVYTKGALSDVGLTLLNAFGATETNTINSFIANFTSLINVDAVTESTREISSTEHFLLGNELDNLEKTLDGIL